MTLFKKQGNNWVKAWKPMVAATDTIVEAYLSRNAKPVAKIQEGGKTSYTVTDLELWKLFLEDNEILLDGTREGLLNGYRLILGEDTVWVADDLESLVPMGQPYIDPETFLKIMINYLRSRAQLQENYVGKKEIAAFCGVSVPTVDRLLREGMPSRKIKSRRVFNKVEVDQWLRG
ncbi:MAG: helix-turn-helix domain-containing protein [Flavobacteriaceae bacterium]